MFSNTGVALVLAAYVGAVSGLQVEQQSRPGVDDAGELELDGLAAEGVALDVSLNLGKDVKVVLNGEPKSGTTWLEFVLKAVLTESCAHTAGCDAVPQDRTVLTKTAADMVTFSLEGKHVIPNIGHKNQFDFSRAPVLSDEQVKQAAARTMEEADAASKWLVIFRDPRDVTISSCFHMFKGCPKPDEYTNSKLGSITAWIDLRYRLFKAVKELAPQRVKFLFYEEMKEDEQGTIMEIAQFFGVPLDKEQAAKIHEQTTFDSMARMPKKEVAQGGAASGKVREGATCGFKHTLSEVTMQSASKQIKRILDSELARKFTC